VAHAGDDARREYVTVNVTIPQADGGDIPIITVPAGKRFVGQAVTCFNWSAPRLAGAQCLLEVNLPNGSLIEMPLPPMPYAGDGSIPVVTQAAPFYLGPRTVLVGYCFITAPIQITVSGYFVKDND
jgi:hypothetical protein